MFRLVPEKIINAKPLLVGDMTPIDIPLDKRGWAFGLVEILFTLVVGTGTGAKSEGELLLTKNLAFETDIDKESHNAPGRAFYRYGQFAQSVAGTKDAIAAANGDYRVQYPIFWADLLSKAPHETMFDARRYDQAQLRVQLGTVADLLTTPGTAAISAASCTITALKTNFDLSSNWAPRFYRYFKGLAAVNHTDLAQKIRRVADLRLRRLFYLLAQSATAGVPFSGTPVDTGVTNVKFDIGSNYEMNAIPRRQLSDDNNRYYKLIGGRPTGWHMLDFMPEGDSDESLILHPGAVTKADFLWETDDATATTVNTLMDCHQTLKV